MDKTFENISGLAQTSRWQQEFGVPFSLSAQDRLPLQVLPSCIYMCGGHIIVISLTSCMRWWAFKWHVATQFAFLKQLLHVATKLTSFFCAGFFCKFSRITILPFFKLGISIIQPQFHAKKDCFSSGACIKTKRLVVSTLVTIRNTILMFLNDPDPQHQFARVIKVTNQGTLQKLRKIILPKNPQRKGGVHPLPLNGQNPLSSF